MKVGFPKLLKSGEKFCFKSVDTAIYNADGRTVADHIAELRASDIKTNDALDVERGRINNIIAESTEDTVNNAELIDIRTGQDGNVYTTAGEAVRGQFLNVVNAIKELTKYTRNAAPDGVGIYDIININTDKTILTSDYVTFPYICSVSVPERYQLSVTVYNYDASTSSYVEVGGDGTSGWVAEYAIPRNIPVIIKLKHVDGSMISKNEIVALSFTEEYPVAMRTTSLTYANFYDSLGYHAGNDNTFSINTISTDILNLGRPIYVKAKDGYNCNVIRFKNNGDGTFTEFYDYGWSKEHLIPIDTYFIFSFAKVSGGLITFDEFVNNFEVEELHHDNPVINNILNSVTGFGIIQTDTSKYESALSITQLSTFALVYDEPTTLYVENQDNSVVIAYNIIENDEIIYHSGWTNSITIPANVLVKVLFDASNSRSLFDIRYKSQYQIGVHPFIKDIAQRGFSKYAPENTLVAYEQAALQGFKYVECDVRFTSDGVPVLLHDETIDRTSNGTGVIENMTYETASTYDFGSWFNSIYAGTQIPRFTDFLELCKNKGLYAYINFDILNETYVQELINRVKLYGMLKYVTWVSGNIEILNMIKTIDDSARLGYRVDSDGTTELLTDAQAAQADTVKTDNNEVFILAGRSYLQNRHVEICIDHDLPLEIWNLNNEQDIITMHKYVSGVLSPFFQAGKYLLQM